jgi:hypothetical protein
MEKLTGIGLAAALNIGVQDRICVSGWLGAGDSVTLQFEADPSAPADEDRPLPSPAYVSTHLARWELTRDDAILARWEDESEGLEQALGPLLGQKVTSWQLDEPAAGLVVNFEGGLQFALGALEGTDIQKRDSWRLRLPDARTRHIRCDGAMYITADGELYTDAEVQELLAQGD